MARYEAYLIQPMSQVVEFETDDPNADLVALAWDESDLHPNISNQFDTDGDGETYFIKNADTGEIVYGEGKP
jgi:hypothetical protein